MKLCAGRIDGTATYDALYCQQLYTLQPATAGLLPPSDSEEESSEEEDSKPKPSPAGRPPRPAVAPAPKK